MMTWFKRIRNRKRVPTALEVLLRLEPIPKTRIAQGFKTMDSITIEQRLNDGGDAPCDYVITWRRGEPETPLLHRRTQKKVIKLTRFAAMISAGEMLSEFGHCAGDMKS